MAVRGLSRGADLPPGVEACALTGLDDREAIAAAVDGARSVVHLAARAHVTNETGSDTRAVYEAYRRVNTGGTAVVLEEAAAAGVERFILASSVKAVGGASGAVIWDESVKPRPDDPYGRSKLEAEEVALTGASMDRVVLRLPLVYGPGVKANMRMLFRVVDRRIPLPVGAVRNRRSVLYVGNLSAAIAHLLARAHLGRGVYFLTDGEDLSTPELVRRIGRSLGRTPILVPVPEPALRAVGRVGDALRRVTPVPIGTPQVERLTSSLAVDSGAFRRRFDFTPPYSVDEGLADTAAWYREEEARA